MLDLVISITIFMSILAILYGGWYVKIDNSSQDLAEFRAQVAARKAINALTNSPGFPSNWAAMDLSPNSDALKGIGLADSKGQIDEVKLTALAYYYNYSPTYGNSKLKMGLSPYDADIRIYYSNGANVTNLGVPPTSANTVLASLQKSAIYRNETVFVRVRLWEPN